MSAQEGRATSLVGVAFMRIVWPATRCAFSPRCSEPSYAAWMCDVDEKLLSVRCGALRKKNLKEGRQGIESIVFGGKAQLERNDFHDLPVLRNGQAKRFSSPVRAVWSEDFRLWGHTSIISMSSFMNSISKGIS